ncbi:MAG: ATP-binding cassette domain-containing protein [Gordonibacter sp.]|nr:ATP-binding cassette domain-containing protein [Gordonibacter sp.]
MRDRHLNRVRHPVSSGVARVPIVMQLDRLEAAAAALDMVLAYCGKWLPLEQVRKDCGIGRDGVRLSKVIQAAENYGLSAEEQKLDAPALRDCATYPCLVSWEQAEYAVICGFRGKNAVVNHPGSGRLLVDPDEFECSYGGTCVTFGVTDAFVPDGKRSSMLKFAQSRLKRNGSVFAVIVLLTLILTVVSLVNPAFARVFVDRILGEQGDWLGPFLVLFGLFGVLQLIVKLVRSTYLIKMEGKFAITSNSRFMWHVLRLPVDFFATRQTGDIIERAKANQNLSNVVMTTLAPMVLEAITFLLYLFVVLQYSVFLSVLGLGALCLNMLISQLVTRRDVNIARVVARDKAKYASTSVSGIEMIETIKASGAESGFFQRWAGFQSAMNTGYIKRTRLVNTWGMIPEFVSSLANIAILLLGVSLVMLGQWSVGMILAFQGYMAGLVAPAKRMIDARATIQGLRSDVERIEDVMGCDPDVEFGDDAELLSTSLDKLQGRIEMRNVTFGYSKQAPPLIENFSLVVNPGDKIAFVGFSGCGKSTIAKMVSGLYSPWSGEILYDGKAREEIPREVFTASLAVVDQDVVLFDGTIASNIKMWDKSIEDFAMICAARDAGMHETIMQRKDGYNHVLVNGGVDLSGGQRQRIEIARVLAQDPSIVVMDEATSALDAKTEAEVVGAIARRGVTSLVIAHRLSTIRDADEIIVLDKGRVVERGTHEELFVRGGLYAKLVSTE